jgi:hypothetical protein
MITNECGAKEGTNSYSARSDFAGDGFSCFDGLLGVLELLPPAVSFAHYDICWFKFAFQELRVYIWVDIDGY